MPSEGDERIVASKKETKKENPKLENMWKLYTDGASSSDSSGAGLMLINLNGKEYTYALRFEFEMTNNKAEYEALLAGLRIEQEMEIKSLAIFTDSQLMVNQVNELSEARKHATKQYLERAKEVLNGFDTYAIEHIPRNQNKKADAMSKLESMTFEHLTKEVLVEVLAKSSISDKEVSMIEAEKGENWMTSIYEYLISGLLPKDPKEARKAESIIEEIHEGSCGFNTEPHSMVVKVTKQGYYWPSMYKDAAKKIQDYTQCQAYSTTRKASSNDAITIGSTWSFIHWGINILGPLPVALINLKFLAIAVEHSTK
ncbi:reverse transcriptase domain-containing protein [Tanacetum coccineum]|uniref:Reverse transcriptase domain-containing protein n=1 Tax=Tanacetum coccineum TaxID=301880 RepID=A0ABQ5CC73_9ASTR